MSESKNEKLQPAGAVGFGEVDFDGKRGRSNSRSKTPERLSQRGSIKQQLARDVGGSKDGPLTLSQHNSASDPKNDDDLQTITRASLRKNSRSFLEEEQKADKDQFNMSSDGSASGKDKDSKKDEQKFFKEQAERLERKLIEKEFFKHYDYKAIYCVFILIFLSNVLINVDHGTLPGCANQFSKAIGIDQAQFGSIGSIVYAGLSLGATVAVVVYQKSNLIKPALVLSLASNAIAIYVFGRSSSFVIDFGLRFGIGFCQVFVCIFMPVWADAFANEKQKSVWLTFLILASPLGVVFGFIMTSVFNAYASDPDQGWRFSFYTQCALLTPMSLGFLFTPLKYLDIDRTNKYREKCQQKVQQQLYKHLNKEKMGDSILGARKSFNPSDIDHKSVRSMSSVGSINQTEDFKIFLEDVNDDLFDHQLEVSKNDSNIRKLREKTLHKIEKEIKKKNNNGGSKEGAEGRRSSVFGSAKQLSFCQKLKSVCTNKVFLSLMFSLTGLFYVVTGIQYWLPDYIQNVLDIEPHTATLYFVIVSLSAPIGGVIVGGIITASYGGYNTKKAQKLQCLMGICAVICCLPVPFFYEKKSFYYVGMLFWGILFFGGFILPPVTGIMINSVPDDQKASANSIANLAYNLFGYLPGPVIYGFVATFTATPGPPGTVNKSRWAMAVLLYSTIPTITCLLWGINKKIKMKDSDEDRRASTLLPKKNENQKEQISDDERQRLIKYPSSDQEIIESQGAGKQSVKSGKQTGLLNQTQSERDSFTQWNQNGSRNVSSKQSQPFSQGHFNSAQEDGAVAANGTESDPSHHNY